MVVMLPNCLVRVCRRDFLLNKTAQQKIIFAVLAALSDVFAALWWVHCEPRRRIAISWRIVLRFSGLFITPKSIQPEATKPEAGLPDGYHAGLIGLDGVPFPASSVSLMALVLAWIGVICAAARMAAAISAALGPVLPDVLMPCACTGTV